MSKNILTSTKKRASAPQKRSLDSQRKLLSAAEELLQKKAFNEQQSQTLLSARVAQWVLFITNSLTNLEFLRCCSNIM